MSKRDSPMYRIVIEVIIMFILNKYNKYNLI